MDYIAELQASAKRNARICRLYGTGRYTLEQLATEFGVSKQRICAIVLRAKARRNGRMR